MNAILERAAELLKSKEMAFGRMHDDRALVLLMGGENLSWTSVLFSEDTGILLTLLTRLSSRVPEHLAAPCALLVARLNAGASLGGFQYDPAERSVHYCVSHPVHNLDDCPKALEILLAVTHGAMEEQAPEILRLLLDRAGQPDSAKASPGVAPAPQRFDLN
jgi:hypothetical protein